MSIAEIFLLGWAIIATVVAVVLHQANRHLRFHVIRLLFGLDLLADGKATLTKDNAGHVTLKV